MSLVGGRSGKSIEKKKGWGGGGWEGKGRGMMEKDIRHVDVAEAVISVVAVEAEFDAKYESAKASSAGTGKG